MPTYCGAGVDVKELVKKPVPVKRLLLAGWRPRDVLALALLHDVEVERRRRRRLRVVR